MKLHQYNHEDEKALEMQGHTIDLSKALSRVHQLFVPREARHRFFHPSSPSFLSKKIKINHEDLHLDITQLWTNVYKKPFTISGPIRTVNLYADYNDEGGERELKFGVYRATEKNAWSFTYVQEYIVATVPVGNRSVRLI